MNTKSFLIIVFTAYLTLAGNTNGEPLRVGLDEKKVGSAFEDLFRDYSFPPGALLGDRLRQFYEKARAYRWEVMSTLDILKENAIYRERMAMVDGVESALKETFSRIDVTKQNMLRSEFHAALRDARKVREFVKYGFTYPDNGNMVSMIFGRVQIEEWRTGMLSWGILYNPGLSVWPREFLDIPPERLSPTGRKITGGDWKGAWEISGGKIYIPGILFFEQVKVKLTPVER